MKVWWNVPRRQYMEEAGLPPGTDRIVVEIEGRRFYVGGRHPYAKTGFVVSVYPLPETRALVVRPLDSTSILLDTAPIS